MKTIDKYILSQFLSIFFAAFVTLVAFYVMIVYRDYVGYFVEYEATSSMVIRYLLFKIPMAVFHVTPICVLVAALLTSVSMSRHSEMTALKAAGVSLVRISAPIIIVSALISGISFANSEYLFSIAARETTKIYEEELKGRKRKTLFAKDRFWYRADDGAIWNIGHINTEQKKAVDISIYFFDSQKGRVVRRITAESGLLDNHMWVFKDYVERDFDAGGVAKERFYKNKNMPAGSFDSEDFNKVKLNPDEMNLAQISEYIADLEAKGYDTTRYTVDWHGKVAFPLITFVMPFIAIPMGVSSSRKGGAMVGVAVALIIGAVFWFLFSMGVALGRAGRLPPPVAAYTAHVLFTATGLLMIFSRR